MNIKETEIIKRLKTNLSQERFEHTLRVLGIAKKLAIKHQANLYQVTLAALLHDFAKEIPKEMLLKKAKVYNLKLDKIERVNTKLWHAKIGAKILEKEWQIKDKAVLNAIKYHTTGKANMSKLCKIIYLADYLDPANKKPLYDKIKKISFEYLDLAVAITAKQILNYLIRDNKIIHPNTFLCWNFYGQKIN